MTTNPLFESREGQYTLVRRGKVRDLYLPGNDLFLMIVATDRISAFDHVLPTPIPDKGCILTQMSNFWFDKTKHIIRNHIVDTDLSWMNWYYDDDWRYDDVSGRVVLVRRAEPLTIEAIVRGYLVGSGWKEYRQNGSVCGIRLPEGLVESEKLPEPIFTPSTKAEAGDHDENITFRKVTNILGTRLAETVRDISLHLYAFAAEYAESRGIIIADTKFEFGLIEGELILIDELFTPDSSRFWPAEHYEPGKSQPSFDKQYVRDYLESIGWHGEPPAPELPQDIVRKTAEKYEEALRRLTSETKPETNEISQ